MTLSGRLDIISKRVEEQEKDMAAFFNKMPKRPKDKPPRRTTTKCEPCDKQFWIPYAVAAHVMSTSTESAAQHYLEWECLGRAYMSKWRPTGEW